jgi:hypothetical protein
MLLINYQKRGIVLENGQTIHAKKVVLANTSEKQA